MSIIVRCGLFCIADGSFVGLQWFANLLMTATTLSGNCTSSLEWETIGFFGTALAALGLSLIGTNLLSHRYLCEKARVMINLYVPPCCVVTRDDNRTRAQSHATSLPNAQPPIRQNDCNSPSARWLKTLEASLVWEGRTLWVVAACPLAFFIYQPAGMAIGGVGILIIVVMVRVHFYFAGWFCRH
jgi:hypothetical protein